MGEVLRPASLIEPTSATETIPRRNAGLTSGETETLREAVRKLVGAEPGLSADLASPVLQALLRQEQQYVRTNDETASQRDQTRSRSTRRAGLAGGLLLVGGPTAFAGYQKFLSPEAQTQKNNAP